MSGQSIDNALKRQFSDTLHIEAQQMISKTAPYLEYMVLNGDDLAYDSFGNVRSQKVTTRNQKIEFADVQFSRRKLARQRFVVPVPIDSADIRGMLADPRGPIVKACLAELNRVKDRIVAEAAFADIQTGKEFGTTVTFANDGGVTVNATAGFTYEKLLEIKSNFKSKDVDIKRIALLMSEQEEEALMKETELTSGDFTRMMPIDRGDMSAALGMEIICFGSNPKNNDPILSVASSTRDNIAIVQTSAGSGICLAMTKDIDIKIQERTDLIETTQVVATMEIGAVRTEGELIQKVQTTAS